MARVFNRETGRFEDVPDVVNQVEAGSGAPPSATGGTPANQIQGIESFIDIINFVIFVETPRLLVYTL